MLLSKIAESESQSAYSAFVGDFKRKLSYFTPTIPSLEPLKDVICFNLIPAITDGNVCSDNNCILLSLSLTMRFGGLAIALLKNDAKYEYETSRKLTLSLTQLIKGWYQIYPVNETEQKSFRTNVNIDKEEQYKAIWQN